MTHRYQLGDRDVAITEIRSMLARLGLVEDTGSDHYDADLRTAVLRFQQERGLIADGVVDDTTYRVLDEARWRLGDRLLSYVVSHPMTGDDVMTLQRRLVELGFDCGQVDGVFRERTHTAVQELQRNTGLPDDGTCGPSTFKVLKQLAPLVTGGRPDALRADEALRKAGTRLSGKVVCIDPGHGAGEPGIQANGLTEADVVADIAMRIEGRLAATGVRTSQTRGPNTAGMDDHGRAAFANRTGANLVVSLHLDSHPNPKAAGVATYYYGLDRPGANSAIGEQFAGLIQRELVARTDAVDCRSHAKTWDLLRHTTMAAVRVDLGYLTNADDAARLADPGARDLIADAIVVAIQRVYLPSHEDAQTGALHLRDLAGA